MIENSNQIIREVDQRFLEEHHSDPAVQYVSGQLLLTRGVGKGYDEQFSSGEPFQVRNLLENPIESGPLFPHIADPH